MSTLPPSEHAVPAGDSDHFTRPLAGIRIVEAASYLAGPFAAQMLSDLGADVIKVEPPGGDPYRNFGMSRHGVGVVWGNANRGKQGVVLDLKTPDGLTAFRELLRSADIYIDNLRPHIADKLGVGKEAVDALNGSLIRLSITGYGPDGDAAREPVFDALVQGRTGLIAYEAAGGVPKATNSFMVDKLAASFVCQLAMAGLLARGRSGKAVHIQTSMLDIVSYFNFPDMFQHRTYLDDDSSWRAPPQPVVATRDGHIVLSPVSGRQLGKTLEAIGHPEWKDELRAIADKGEMTRTFFQRIAAPLKERTSQEWLATFREFEVPCGPVNDPDEHLEDPQVLHNRLYSTLDTPFGPIRSVRYPGVFDGHLLTARFAAPGLGEHDGELSWGAGR
ncbi:CaiB/BaiF CoA transferase family protein [Paraburkholderia sp. BCC1886]|uniref:CaiB/BaiF CoA transferase family protein n=1 Tax=Paraburkholderia sp. BCC1886 TaxID=2562670 RepID=UPI001181CB17|nr:CoA transferase [Paraburkholderia sp. BCC1886]